MDAKLVRELAVVLDEVLDVHASYAGVIQDPGVSARLERLRDTALKARFLVADAEWRIATKTAHQHGAAKAIGPD